MSPTLLYRIAAALLVLFAAGHTAGFLRFRPDTAEGLSVLNSMMTVQFEFKGKAYSYGNFYTGFGLTISAYLLFAAFLSWHLGNMAATQPQAIGLLAWAFVTVQLICLVLSVRYFFIAPALFSGVIVICLAWAALLLRTHVA